MASVVQHPSDPNAALQKCDGVQPRCTRCARIGKTCVFRPLERIPNTRRLEDKIAELEGKLAKLSSKSEPLSPTLLTRLDEDEKNATDQSGEDRPFIPLFPHIGASPPRPGFVTQSGLNESYGSLIPRRVVEGALLAWDQDVEMPSDLCDML